MELNNPELNSSDKDSLEKLHHDMEADNLDGLWRRAGALLTSEPQAKGEPYLWKWRKLEQYLKRAGELVGMDNGGDRRVIRLINPSLEAPSSTTHTISATFQHLLAGEIAPVHRHSPAALRFIVTGNGAYTKVEGERIDMEPGDLILTPSWTWHDHGNPTDSPASWIDAVDTPLILRLKAMFFQPGNNLQEVSQQTEGYTARRAGKGWLNRPELQLKAKPVISGALPMVYRWRDVEPILLESGAERSPFDGDILAYANPVTGNNDTLPTMACSVQRLFAGESTKTHRHLSSTVYHVIKGEGETEVEGRMMPWSKGDVFTIPTWKWHAHKAYNQSEAILFSISDQPIMEKLGLYREEASED